MPLLANSLSEAVEYLAKRAAERQRQPQTWQEKQAEEMSDLLGGLGRWAGDNPLAASGLAGGVAGAGLGGIGTALSNRNKDKGERRSVLGSALTGGMAGAALGAGGAAAYKGYQGYNQPKGSKVTELNSLVKELQKRDWSDRAALGTLNLGGRTLKKNWGTAATVAGIGGVDAALHNDRWNLGETIGLGRARARTSNDVADLRAGIGAAIGKPGDHGFDDNQAELLRSLHNGTPDTLQALANDHSQGHSGIVNISSERPGIVTLKELDSNNNLVSSRQQVTTENYSAPQRVRITPEQLGHLKELGVKTRFPGSDKIPGSLSEPYMFRAPGMRDMHVTGSFNRGWRGMGRGLAYGAPIVGSVLWNAYSDNSAKEQQLAKLMAEHPELAGNK